MSFASGPGPGSSTRTRSAGRARFAAGIDAEVPLTEFVTTSFWRLPSEVGLHEPGPLWPGPRPANILAADQAAQATVLLARPSRLVTLPVLTLIDNMWRWREMIGVLGLPNVVLSFGFYPYWPHKFGRHILIVMRSAI
jgi:hypothetical protein